MKCSFPRAGNNEIIQEMEENAHIDLQEDQKAFGKDGANSIEPRN